MQGCCSSREAGGILDNSIFRQVAELHVTEGFPWADHCDVCAKTLHAGDIIAESLLARLGGLALEGAGGPLLELGWGLLVGGSCNVCHFWSVTLCACKGFFWLVQYLQIEVLRV